MLNVENPCAIVLSVVMMNAVIMSVIMLSVAAPIYSSKNSFLSFTFNLCSNGLKTFYGSTFAVS